MFDGSDGHKDSIDRAVKKLKPSEMDSVDAANPLPSARAFLGLPSAQSGGSLSLASLVWLACWIIGMIDTRRLAKKG